MINKQEVLSALKADLKSADTLRQEIIAKVEQWKREYNGEPYGNEQKGKSRIVSRDIKRQDEWQHSSIKDPFVSDVDIVKVKPYSAEDRPLAEQTEAVLNFQFTKQFNRYNFITKGLKALSREGTLICKTSWCYADKEVEVDHPILAVNAEGEAVQVGTKKVKEIKILENRPDAEVCRIQDIYIDPTCEGETSKAQFIAHEYETDITSLKKSGKYKNLSKVAAVLKKGEDSDNGTIDYDNEDDTNFTFKDVARKKLVVTEYTGNFDVNGTGVAVPIMATWVKDIMIQLIGNPFPDKEINFLLVKNNETPFTIHGEANAESIGDNQKVSTAIKRSFIDNMANSNNAQKGIKANSLDAVNKKRFLNNQNFEFMGSKQDFFEGSYNNIPNSAFSVLELINNETESLVGVKGFSGGITGNGLGTTATSARGALDATSVRRLDIVRNIAENLIKPLMRKWASYNSKFLSPEEVERITNKPFVPSDPDDPKRLLDITVEVSTSEDNASKAQELAFLLQTLGQSMDLGMRNLLMSQLAKLHKMPDLAEQLASYQPQPDPQEQEIKQLQIEKLKVEIEERRSRAVENSADLRLKTAKAVVEEAKGESIMADTDLKDLEFTDKASGVAFNQEIEKKTLDRNTQLDLKALDNYTRQ